MNLRGLIGVSENINWVVKLNKEIFSLCHDQNLDLQTNHVLSYLRQICYSLDRRCCHLSESFPPGASYYCILVVIQPRGSKLRLLERHQRLNPLNSEPETWL
jgi:hypothetical protein